MVCGTMSSAGKSMLVTGLCRIFVQDGFRCAPFKSQNMANNSYVTRDGKEMGRAQVVQAQAANVEPDAAMNPILLKPTGNHTSQVIVRGRPVGTKSAREYFAYKKSLLPVIRDAYASLEEMSDIVVVEGAGSPAEINLKEHDIVNMGLAQMVGAPVILVADIDRGGVFAQLYGTVMLLPEEERQWIRGMVINKFRGDPSLLDDGIQQIEAMLGIPVIGLIPYMEDLQLPDEDSLSLHMETTWHGDSAVITIAVIRYPRISNVSDFDVFGTYESVRICYVTTGAQMLAAEPDVIILPGSKNVAADLLWMRERGLTELICKRFSKTLLMGICGGFEMLGECIADPFQVESSMKSTEGLGELPVRTVMGREKVTRACKGRLPEIRGAFSALSYQVFDGYEIHNGQAVSMGEEDREYSEDEKSDRTDKSERMIALGQGRSFGTFIHGVFDEVKLREVFLQSVADYCHRDDGWRHPVDHRISTHQFIDMQIDRLADVLRRSMDMNKIYGFINQ